MKYHLKYLIIFYLLGLVSCNKQLDIKSKKGSLTQNYLQDSIGYSVFNIKDTTSNLYISYHECTECTECLDAWVDSGKLFIPKSVHQKIKEVENKRGKSYVPNGYDLYLTGPYRINETLFGDSLNYGEHWGDKFLITGKAIDIKGYGIVFRVDNYRKINE